MLPKSPSYTKAGFEATDREVTSLLPVRNLTGPNGQLTRWDGTKGTVQELSAIALKEIRAAAEEPSGGDWVDLGQLHGVDREYHRGRTAQGNGNRFFRFKSTMKVPPQLIIAGLLEPTVFGQIDKMVAHARVLYDFPDGRNRLMNVVAWTGPRPFFYDRDDCAVSTYFPPHMVEGGKGEWYHISYTVPEHFPSVSTGIRNYTMYWGYKLEPFVDSTSGETHTRITLISQTEIFGWHPKALVNHFIPNVLSDYIRDLEKNVAELQKRGAPARLLVESFGLTL